MSLEQGWVTKLAVYLEERDAGIQVVNASISGETTAGGLRRLPLLEIPPNYGTRYTSGFRESFRQVALETDCTLAPFILDGVATNPALMQGDGIHPTVEAQPLLLDNVLPTVNAVLDKS